MNETETNDYVLCKECQSSYHEKDLTDCGLCQTCYDSLEPSQKKYMNGKLCKACGSANLVETEFELKHTYQQELSVYMCKDCGTLKVNQGEI